MIRVSFWHRALGKRDGRQIPPSSLQIQYFKEIPSPSFETFCLSCVQIVSAPKGACQRPLRLFLSLSVLLCPLVFSFSSLPNSGPPHCQGHPAGFFPIDLSPSPVILQTAANTVSFHTHMSSPCAPFASLSVYGIKSKVHGLRKVFAMVLLSVSSQFLSFSVPNSPIRVLQYHVDFLAFKMFFFFSF